MIKNNCLGLVFANMHDVDLNELTENRTTGSIPFCGRYRLIDFSLSNMVNSGISTVGIITKHNFASLMDHLGSGRNWDLARKRGGLVILPPYGRPGTGVYDGRLEALCNAKGWLEKRKEDYIIISDSNVIANINFSDVVDYHEKNGADVTMIYKETETDDIGGEYHIIETENGHVTDIVREKGKKGKNKLSLDIIVMRREDVIDLCTEAQKYALTSFSGDYIRKNIGKINVIGYEFQGFSQVVNSMKNYYDCNMELLSSENSEKLFLADRPVYTKVRDDFPASYGLEAKASNSMIADGCIIEGTVENSVLFRGVTVAKGAVVRDSILMQGTSVGENSSLDCVVTDKNVKITADSTLSGSKNYPVYFSKGKTV